MTSQWADVEKSESAPTQLIKEEIDGLLSFMAGEVAATEVKKKRLASMSKFS